MPPAFPPSLELSSIADIFNCTENDVLRALKYWHKSGVLDLKLDEQGNLNSVRLLPVGANLPQASTSAANIVSTASTSTEIQPVRKLFQMNLQSRLLYRRKKSGL